LDLKFEVEYLLVFAEKGSVHSHEIVEKIVIQTIKIDLVLELRVDLPHYLIAKLEVQTAYFTYIYLLGMTCIDLFALIIDMIKFSFSTRIFYSSFSIRNLS